MRRRASHFCRSFLIQANRGVKFKEYSSTKRAGSCMPRYVIALVFQVKGKLFWHSDTLSSGSEMFRAYDLSKLILRLEICWKWAKSFNKFGMVTCGSTRVSNMSSAKAVILNSCSETKIPQIFGLFLMRLRNGSNVSI